MTLYKALKLDVHIQLIHDYFKEKIWQKEKKNNDIQEEN